MGVNVSLDNPHSVPAAELVRNFAECRELAAKQTLYVTHHGRATHVLVGIDRFNDLKTIAAHQSGSAEGEESTRLIFAMTDWLDEAVILCDADMNILFVNRVGQAVCRKPAHELTGRLLLDALPQVAGSLLEVHARRTMTGGEFSAADIPSPFHSNSWLHFQSFPLDGWNVLMFRDITEDVQRHQLADMKEGILGAMSLHGDIAYLRLSIRGTIDRLNAPCAQLIGLPEDRLLGVGIADLIATPDRARFREALEKVLRGDGSRRMDVRILTNDGELAAVQTSLVQLHGAYGVDGAIMLATRLPLPG